MTRYLTALTIVVVLALSLSGCGDGKEGDRQSVPSVLSSSNQGRLP
ncbi:MAG: hypothetical protein U0N16_02815 [Desulfovibrio sp.]